MNNHEKISIIIPIYNMENYLEKCINSVVEQTYKNLEIILVDDGSTDNSLKICNAFSDKDARIQVIHKENGGLSDARNVGIDAANGSYLMFVDSDDYIRKNMLEVMYNDLIEKSVDICMCAYSKVDEKGNPIEKTAYHLPIEQLTPEQYFTKLRGIGCAYYVVSVCKLYKRELFENLRFKKEKIHEDEFIIHEVISRCNKISVIDKIMYFYYIRSNSIMTGAYSVRRLDAIEAFCERTVFFENHNFYKTISHTFWAATFSVVSAYNQLDMKEKKNRKRYFEVIAICKKTYKVCAKHIKINSLRQVYFLLLVYFPKSMLKLYCLLKHIHSKLK